MKSSIIKKNQTVLMIGDSITFGGRDFDNPDSVGHSWVYFTSVLFSKMFPDYNVKFYNRGIGGNRVAHLKLRWKEDCIALNPDWVSILIGVNDTWRRYDENNITSIDDYEHDYRTILSRVKTETKARIILCEPFLVGRDEMREDLDPRREVTRKLAKEFEAIFIPYDEIFQKATSVSSNSAWTQDGVHPTLAGYMLMAEEWIKAVTQ